MNDLVIKQDDKRKSSEIPNNDSDNDYYTKKAKYPDENFTIINLNKIIHNQSNISIGFIDQKFFDKDTFICYFIREICYNINDLNVINKYIRILEQLKTQLNVFGANTIDLVILFLSNKFIIFVKKFNMIDKLEEEVKAIGKTNFKINNLIKAIGETIVAENLISMYNTNKPKSNLIYYLQLVEELSIYRSYIDNQDIDISIRYIRGFYSIYLTIMIDLIYNLDKIKSIELFLKVYDAKYLIEYSITNFDGLYKLFNSLDISKYVDCIQMIFL